MPLDQVAREALGRHLAKLDDHMPAARAGSDPEAIHVMRTSLRRIRTILQVLEGSSIYDARRLRRLRRRLGRLARRLGRARDLDVLAQHVEAYAQAHPGSQDGTAPLRAQLQRRRDQAQTKLIEELDRRRTRRARRQLRRMVARGAQAPGAGTPVLVRHFAGSAIWRRYEAVLAYEHALADATPAALHQLRIACKRLRYTLELFAEPLGPGTEPLLRTLVAVQDHLGALQDHVAALERSAPIVRAHPDNHALAAYTAARAAERDALQTTIAPLWNELAAPWFRASLAALIAAL
jgi:CHAD domain-containing protein